MTQILSLPIEYSGEYLNFNRVFPLIDTHLQNLISRVSNGYMVSNDHCFLDNSMQVMDMNPAITRDLFGTFKTAFQAALETNPVNTITGLATAHRIDIVSGCTQYIDSLYMRYGPNGIQVLEREYNYHGRLNPNIVYKTIETLEANMPLIISQPFYYGTTHVEMQRLLDSCLNLNIPVHIDGAWITACKNIIVDFTHPAIHSFASSMSKGYGLSGWNRIGLRWTKENVVDSVTIMNDFVQIPAENVSVGLFFLNQIEPNHLWNTHGANYARVCQDFNLTPTDSIHLAIKDNVMIGVEALLRYLEAQ